MKRDLKMQDIKCGMLPAEQLHTRDYNSKQASTSIIHCINCEHERTLSGRQQKNMLVYPRSHISCHSLWRRTFNELQKLSRLTCNLHHFITTRFLNYILYFIMVLSRFLSSWKYSYKRTYLHCLLLVYGVLLFSTYSLGEEVTFMSQRQGKLLDSFIPVGMGFVYKIPNRTFDCDIERLEASEGSSRTLPWWLAFDETKQTFYGVPSMKDIGSYEILVVAVARSESETGKICGMRAFTIYVSLEDKNHFNFEGPVLKSISGGLESSETQPSKISNNFVCIPGLQAVLATVVISADIHKLNGHQRMTVLEGMAQHMNFSSSKIALFANADGHPLISQLEDPSIVISGSGDGRYKKGPKSILTWKVSCGAMRLGTAYLSELETNAQDGTISNVLGYPVVGWHVTSGVQKAKHRARRAIAGASTPTPTTTAILPTQVKNISTVMITDSISLTTAFVSPNSTLMPSLTFPSTLQITPTTTVLMSPTPVEATVNLTSSFPVISTTLDTVQTSTPALSSVNLTTVLESITPSPAANISIQINSTAIAETENSTGIVLSTQFQNTSVVASSGIATRASSVSVVISSTSILNITRVSSTSVVNSTFVMNSTRVSSTSVVNSSTSVLNSTRVSSTSVVNSSTSVLNSTRVSSTSVVNSTFVMNSTRVSSTSVVSNTSVLQLDNSTTVFLFNSSIMTSTISSVTPSPTVFLPENSSAIVNNTTSSMLPPGTDSSTASITLNQTEMFTSTVASSALVNNSVVTSVVPFSVTTVMPSSVDVNGTSFMNQTSSIQPSFQTSSLHPPFSTTTSSLAMNVTSNSTSMPSASLVMSNTSVVMSSSTSNATDGVVLTSVVNSSTVVSVVTPLSTVLITSVNMSSTTLLPTVMNSSLVDATSIASSLVGNTSVLSVILSTVSPNATIGLDASTNFSRVSLTSANASSFVYPTSSKDVVQTSVTNTTGFLTKSPTVILNTTVFQTTNVIRTLQVQNLSFTVVTSMNTTLFETETQTIRPTATYDRSSTLLTSTEIINVSSPSTELSRTVDLLNTTAAILPSFTTTNKTLRTTPSPSLGTLNTSITEHIITSFSTVSTVSALVLSATLNDSSLMTESRSLVVNRSVTSTFFPSTNMTLLLLPSSMTSRISPSSLNSSVANFTEVFKTETVLTTATSVIVQNYSSSFKSLKSPTLATVNMTTKLMKHNETRSVQPSSTLISQNSTSVLTMQNQSSGIPTSVVPSPTLLAQRNMSSTSILLNDSSLMTESRSLVMNGSVTSAFFPSTNMTLLLLPSSMTSRISSSSLNSSVANFTEVLTETVLATATSVIVQHYSSSFKSTAITISMTSSMLTAIAVNVTSLMLIQNQTVSLRKSPTLVTVNMTTKLTTHNATSSVQPSSTLISQDSTSVLTRQNQSSGIPTSVVPSSTLLAQRNMSSTSILMKNSSSPVTSFVTPLMTSWNATTLRAFSIAQSSSLELPYSSVNASKDVNTSGSAPTSSRVFSTSVVPSSTDNVTMSTAALSTSSSVVTSPSSVVMETQTPYPTVTPSNVSGVPLSSSLTPPLTTSLPVSTVASSSSNYTSDILNGTKTMSLVDKRLTTNVSSLALTTVPVNSSSEIMLPSTATPTVLTSSSLPNSSLSTTMIASSSIISTTVLGTTSEYLEFSTSVPSSNVTTLVVASTTFGLTSSSIVLEETRVVTSNSSTPYASTTLMVSSVLSSSSPLVFTSSPNISSVTQTMITALRTSLAKSSVFNLSAITSTTLPPSMFTSSFVSLSTSSYKDGTSVFTSAISTVLSSSSSSVVGNSTVVAPVTSQTSFSPSTSFILSSANISTVSPTSQTTSSVVPATDLPPRLRNEIGRLQATAGKVFRYVIPEDVFYDEDGNTRNLSLTLKRFNDELVVENITKDYWLMFDGSKQEIYGLPMEKDVPSDPERGIKFLLEARDRLRQIGYDAFEIMITKSNIPYTQSLSMKLLNDFTEFEQNISQRMDLVSRISRYYGDPDTSQVRVLSYSEGSVLFTWTNDSLPSDVCNTTQLNYVAEKVVGRDSVTVEFTEYLAPEYSVTSANRTLTGVCNATIVPPPLIPNKVVGKESSGLWEKHVLPGIIVAVILIIIAILLLLIVLRRRRANPSDPEKRTYKKRKPIILEPEMEMKPRSGKPLILENDELSHPPSYMSEMSLDKTPHYDSDDYDEEDYKSTPTRSSPVYETPPPVYNVPREPFEQPPPAYRLPPTFYSSYALPPWETSSDV